MPLTQRTWQDRWCLSPLIVTRHSKQIPMPQSGPRGLLVTDRRSVETPKARMAAATLVPRGTVQEAPLIVRASVSAILFPGNDPGTAGVPPACLEEDPCRSHAGG